jgi:hypothetical protein
VRCRADVTVQSRRDGAERTRRGQVRHGHGGQAEAGDVGLVFGSWQFRGRAVKFCGEGGRRGSGLGKQGFGGGGWRGWGSETPMGRDGG